LYFFISALLIWRRISVSWIDPKIPFQSRRLTYSVSFEEMRTSVNAVLMLQLMGFTSLTALGFYLL